MLYYNVYRMEVWTLDYRLPYYMAYPFTREYDEEKTARMDLEYMKSMYPQLAKKLLPYVEDECERMSYEGSMIYDEYPDCLSVRMICRRICEKIKDIKEEEKEYVKDMVQVLVFQELHRRRCVYRKKKRNFYL